MTKRAQTKFNKHYRWISQDDHMTEIWQVMFSSWVNLNKNTYHVSVNPAIVEWRSTNWNKMLAWFYTEDSGWNRSAACAWEDGEVYKVNGTDDVADFIFSDWRNVANAINMWEEIFFVRPSWSWQIRVGKTNKSNTNLTNITENITTTWEDLPDGTIKSKYPMFNFNNNIVIIWVGGTLCTIDRSWIVTNYAFFAEDIVSITRVGGKFRIYSSNWEIAFWRFWELWIDESYNIDDYQNWYLRGAINRWSVDFIVSWFNSQQSDIRLGAGYDAPIKAHYIQSERINQEKFKVDVWNVRQLTRIWDTIFFVNETENDSQALWSFGYKNVIFWDAFQEERLFDGWNIHSIYWFQWPWDDNIYMSTSKSSAYKISSYDLNWAEAGSWEIYYNIMDGWDATIEKKMVSIFETVSNCSDGNTVEILLSYDGWAFESQRVISESSWIDRKEISTNKEFTDLVLKVIITWNARHHAARAKYDITEEE